MSWNFELVAGPYGGTTEGPVWDGQAVLFTNIPNNRILRYDPKTGQTTEYVSQPPTATAVPSERFRSAPAAVSKWPSGSKPGAKPVLAASATAPVRFVPPAPL